MPALILFQYLLLNPVKNLGLRYPLKAYFRQLPSRVLPMETSPSCCRHLRFLRFQKLKLFWPKMSWGIYRCVFAHTWFSPRSFWVASVDDCQKLHRKSQQGPAWGRGSMQHWLLQQWWGGASAQRVLLPVLPLPTLLSNQSTSSCFLPSSGMNSMGGILRTPFYMGLVSDP